MTGIHQAKKEVDKLFSREDLIVFYEKYFSSLLMNNMNKFELVEHFVKTFTDKDRFKKFVSKLDPSVKETLYKIVWYGSMSAADINSLTGKKSAGMEYGHFKIIDPSFSMFNVYSASEFKLGFSDALRKIMKTYMKAPEGYDLSFAEVIEETGFSYCDNNSILADVDDYISFIKKLPREEIKDKYGQNIIPKKTVKKLEKDVATKEFFPEDKTMMSIKKTLLTNFFLNYSAKNISDPKVIVKESINNFLKSNNGLFELVNILTHLKTTYAENTVYTAKKNFMDFLKTEFKVNQWLNIDDLLRFVSLRDIDFYLFGRDFYNYTHFVYYSTAEEYQSPFASHKSTFTEKNFLTDAGSIRLFTYVPYVKGMIFLCASLGILDIKYNYPISLDSNMKDLFYFEGLKYVRLTSFGEYILGLKDDYTYSITDDTEVKLFDNALMIKVEGESPKKRNLLEKVSIPISDTLYKTDARTFYSSCTSSVEVLRIIEKFKEIVTGDVPDNWITFFRSLRAKMNPFKEVSEVLRLKLPIDDSELQEIILKDTIIKKIILKAENYNIIIAEKDYQKLMNRLKNYGYFCDKL